MVSMRDITSRTGRLEELLRSTHDKFVQAKDLYARRRLSLEMIQLTGLREVALREEEEAKK
jgi:hypothetical protein